MKLCIDIYAFGIYNSCIKKSCVCMHAFERAYNGSVTE